MKVICVHSGYKNPLSQIENNEWVVEGEIYTVVNETNGFSTYADREVEVYEFSEIKGYWEKGMFMPLSDIDEFDMALKVCLKTKPIRTSKK